jgi:hypothetical protein
VIKPTDDGRLAVSAALFAINTQMEIGCEVDPGHSAGKEKQSLFHAF